MFLENIINSPVLLFSLSLTIIWIGFVLFGSSYAIDLPNNRKKHDSSKSQIGGVLFGLFYIIIIWFSDLAPMWYAYGCITSILLGTLDDIYSIDWKIKLTIQLGLVAFIINTFLGTLDSISFYQYSNLYFGTVLLVILFIFWFVGIYNSVNLIDGLDGLAGGFMFIICLGASLNNNSSFVIINFILAMILLGFLIFNQRPSKLFMGDSGSLLLGFHMAVLPLLFFEYNFSLKNINMTPFLLLVFFLVADTSRVFFTRLLNKKNPMDADTIHFHHLIIQQSGSYLASLGSIYLITLFSVVTAIFGFYSDLSTNIMFAHLALLLIFILTPPVETYAPMITNSVKPFYTWQRNNNKKHSDLSRTIFMVILLIGLIISLLIFRDLQLIIKWQTILAFILTSIFILKFINDKISMYVIQLFIVLVFSELCWNTDFSTFSKIFSMSIIISFIIFTLEKRNGCNISFLSSLDLLVIIITIGGIMLTFTGFFQNSWFFLEIFSLWFSLAFILKRTIYIEKK